MDGEHKPAGFWTLSLNSNEKNYSVLQEEFLTVVWAMQTRRVYIRRAHFTAGPDQVALQWLMEVFESSNRLMG